MSKNVNYEDWWTPTDLSFHVAGVLEMAATESTIRFSGHTLDKATKAKVSTDLASI